MPTPKKKVLILRLSSLGDVVHCTSALELWHDAGWEVSFLTKKAFSGILASHPKVANLLEFDPKSGGGESQERERLFAWIRAAGFDVILDLHDSWRTWFWRSQLRKFGKVFVLPKDRLREWVVLFLRMGSRFGYQNGGRAKRIRDFSAEILAGFGNYPALPVQLTKLYLGSQFLEKNQALDNALPKKEQDSYVKLPFFLPENFIALLPGGAWASKAWPYYPELAAIASRSHPVVILGAEKDLICDEIERHCRNSKVLNLKGKTNLQESMIVLSKANWIVGNDTGFVHVAEALGKDVVAVEGPTHRYLGFSAYRSKSQVVGLDLFCRPCSKSGSICIRWGSRKCLKGLPVSQVIQALRAQGFSC